MSERGTVIITGAGSGIGRATAIELSRRNYAVALVGRREAMLSETAAACVGTTRQIPIDISEPGACQRVLTAAIEKPSALLAGLVNNAGWAPSANIAGSDEEMIRGAFAINSVAPAILVATAWEALAAGAEQFGRAAIVNVSSVATIDPFPILYAYACSKISLNMNAQFVQMEGSRLGIKGFAILPGAVETAMLRGLISESELPTSMALRPETIALVIADCMDGARDKDAGTQIVVAPTH